MGLSVRVEGQRKRERESVCVGVRSATIVRYLEEQTLGDGAEAHGRHDMMGETGVGSR